MSLNPRSIYDDFISNKINKTTSVALLNSLIEESEDNDLRLTSLDYIDKIHEPDAKLYNILEQLFLSDSSSEIRYKAFEIISKKYLDKVVPLIKWALSNENDYNCLVICVRTLVNARNSKCTAILKNKLKFLLKQKYFDNERQYETVKYRRSLKKMSKAKKLNNLDCLGLAEIIINYFTIQTLFEKFYYIFYDIKDGLVTSLDLSELGWNINLWRLKYHKRLTSFSEVPGLENLKHLEVLDFSNNRLNSLEGLPEFKNLKFLHLANNRLSINDFEIFRKYPKLEYLDVHGNILDEYLDFKNEKFRIKYRENLL